MKYLTGNFLVSAPKIDDVRFKETVVFIYKHNIEGAIGFIINKPINKSIWMELCRQAHIEHPVDHSVRIYYGGPVETQIGYVLHTPDYNFSTTEPINKWLSVTQGTDILVDIAGGTGPMQFLIVLGYCSWAPGQLELEMEAGWPRDPNSGWMLTEASGRLMFSTDSFNKWEIAIDGYATNYVDTLLKFETHTHE